jgi:putative FmdB family regulatory protein
MATYNYLCPKDGTEKEVNMPLSQYDSSKLVRCPECKSKMRRKFSPPSISIK